MFDEELAKRREDAQAEGLKNAKHAQKIQKLDSIEETIAKEGEETRKTLVKHQPAVTVKNLPSIASPEDIKSLKEAVEELKLTTEEKDIDFSRLEAGLDVLATKIEEGFESIPQAPEPLDTVSVDNQIDTRPELEKIKEAIEKQKLDPKIDVQVPETQIDVDNTKVAEIISDTLKEALAVLEPTEFDTSKIESTLKEIKKFVKATAERPLPIGGGSSGAATTRDWDYLSISNSNTDEDTFTYKKDGASGTTVRTLVIGYAAGAEKVSDSIASLDYS